MIGELGLLADWLKTHTSLERSQRVRAIYLCGRRPCDLFIDTVVRDQDLLTASAASRAIPSSKPPTLRCSSKNDRIESITPDEFERLLTPWLPKLPWIREGHATLKEFLEGQIEDLTERYDLIDLREKRDLGIEVLEDQRW